MAFLFSLVINGSVYPGVFILVQQRVFAMAPTSPWLAKRKLMGNKIVRDNSS